MNHRMRIPLAALLCASMGSVVADEKAQTYNIPAQPLHSALQTLADQAGVAVFFSENQVTGKTSPVLNGQYSAREAFQKLLAGSGLTYTFTAEDSVSIKAADSGSDAAATLPAVKVLGKAINSDTDPYNSSYIRHNSSTAMKTETPIMESPMSVQVIPQQVIKDQQVITVDDAVKNVSGVQRDWGYGNLYDSFIIRGFASSSEYRNGFRLQNYTAETANVESIDVLKGPAAMLYGRVEPGGMVNIVTKKPLDHAYYSLQQQFSSYDFYRTAVDATGPLNRDKSLLYRINLAYTDSNSFRDNVFNDRLFISPSLTWHLSDRTDVNLDFEYKKNDFVIDHGIPALNGANRPVNVPISRTFHEPGNHVNTEDYLVDLNWSHNFNDDWKIQNGFVARVQDYALETVVSPFVRDDNQHVGRFANFAYYPDRHSYGAFVNLTGKFNTYGVQHEVLFGSDWFEYSQSQIGSFQAVSDINIFNPVYGSVDFNQQRASLANTPNNMFKGDDEWFGIYFQDQITLWEKLHILGGGRHDWARAKSGFSDVSLAAINQGIVNTSRFQPRVGIVYQPWTWLSLFGNYVESLGSNNGLSSNNVAFAPELAEQFEGGIKTELFDGKLTSSLAYFHIDKSNMLTADLSTPNDFFDQVAIGKARSRGVEWDLRGQLSEELSVIGTYAYTDARIIKNADGNVGHRLPNVPENSGSLWAKYDFKNHGLNGFSIGTGAYVVGKREGDNENTLQLPGYLRWDAMAAYRFKLHGMRLTTQFNVNNILDKRFFKATDTLDGNPRGRVTVGEPLTLMGSIKLEY